MSALSELQSHISDFVLGKVALGQFCDWFVDRLWDVEQSSDKKTKSAFYLVEGLLAESSHGGWNESGIRQELATALRPFEQLPVTVFHKLDFRMTRRPPDAIRYLSPKFARLRMAGS